jgi:hypothetical protein
MGLSSPLPPPPVGPLTRATTSARALASATARTPQLVNPPSGATYLIDPTLRREFQSLQLKVVTPAPTRIEWSINGVPFSAAISDASIDWPLRPGRHTITARDTVGNVAQATVTVR